MSGGAWGYLSFRIEEQAQFTNEGLLLLAAIEHELDWGRCGDTCYECAKLRTITALEAWFGSHSYNGEKMTWQEALNSDKIPCPRCAQWKESKSVPTT